MSPARVSAPSVPRTASGSTDVAARSFRTSKKSTEPTHGEVRVDSRGSGKDMPRQPPQSYVPLRGRSPSIQVMLCRMQHAWIIWDFRTTSTSVSERAIAH